MDFKQSTAVTVFRGREKYRLWSTSCDKHGRVRHGKTVIQTKMECTEYKTDCILRLTYYSLILVFRTFVKKSVNVHIIYLQSRPLKFMT